VLIYLHALSMGHSGGPRHWREAGFCSICPVDHNMTWWQGRTEERLNAQLDFLLDRTRYPVDLDRVYLAGQSMGGAGTIVNALRYPARYAAAYGQNASIGSQPLEHITPEANLPPIAVYFGFRDSGGHGPKGHAPFLRKMADCRQGVWARWEDVGHTIPDKYRAYSTAVPGGLLRFRRDELFPCFSNTSTDSNAGQRGPDNVVSNGTVNLGVDWASSLHSLGLKDETLVDTNSTLAVTFRSETDCTTDVSFRRLQRFEASAGATVQYANVAVETGAAIREGTAVIGADRVVTVKDVRVLHTGNRLTVRLVTP
jgi:hypothetical protein